jgi:hypothetical protein
MLRKRRQETGQEAQDIRAVPLAERALLWSVEVKPGPDFFPAFHFPGDSARNFSA